MKSYEAKRLAERHAVTLNAALKCAAEYDGYTRGAFEVTDSRMANAYVVGYRHEVGDWLPVTEFRYKTWDEED